MYKLAYTERFKKAFNDLTNNEQIQFQNKMKLFVENVLHPSLRTKRIKGQKGSERSQGSQGSQGSKSVSDSALPFMTLYDLLCPLVPENEKRSERSI